MKRVIKARKRLFSDTVRLRSLRPNRYASFVKKHARIPGVTEATLVLGTFLFKEVMRERLQNLDAKLGET
jgi:hypothetical protein